MAELIGSQDGIKAAMNRLRDLDPGGTLLKKGSGSWPDISTLSQPLDQWKAYDKLQRTLQILKQDHDSPLNGGGDSGYVPPPDTSLAHKVQNVLFCAQHSEAALQSPVKFKPALTADPAYSQWATPDVVAQFRAQNRQVYAWGVQTQIPAQAIRDLANRLNLDGCIFQGETQEEYETAIQAGAEMIVANPNAWNDQARQDANNRIAAGKLAVIGECYTNLGGPWPKDYSSGGVNIASVCIGVYDGSGETAGGWNPSVASYKQETPSAMWPAIGVYHAAGVNPAEWPLLA